MVYSSQVISHTQIKGCVYTFTLYIRGHVLFPGGWVCIDIVHVKLKVVIALLIICDIEVVSLSTSLYLSESQIRRSEYCRVPFSFSGTNSGTSISSGILLGVPKTGGIPYSGKLWRGF